MKYIYLVPFFIIMNFNFLLSSSFSITEVDTVFYPEVSVSFSAYDNGGNFISDLTPADFVIRENGNIIPEELVQVLCDGSDAPLNVVIVLDQSTSMDSLVDNKSKLNWVREAAQGFIEYVENRDSVFIALTAFAGLSKVKCNFSNDSEELLDSLNKIDIVTSVTNFNNAFMQAETGAIDLLKTRPNYQKRAIIFLSDGYHKAGSDYFRFPELQDKLVKSNIQLYAITFLHERDNVMDNISFRTGGSYFNLSNPEDLGDVYKEIADILNNNSICQLIWETNTRCYDDNRNTKVDIQLIKTINETVETNYISPFNSLVFFRSENSRYFMGNPPANSSVETTIRLFSELNNTLIKDYELLHPEYFTVIDWGGYGPNIPPAGILMEPGESLDLTVRFTQSDVRTERKSLLIIETEPCDAVVELLGGNQKVFFTEPDENNIYSTCKSIDISWDGIEDGTEVDLSYQKENEANITNLVKNYVEKTFTWSPSDISAKYRFFVNESERNGTKWISDFGSTGDDKVIAVTLDENELFLYAVGYFSDQLDIQNNPINSEGGTDAFVAKFDIYGNLKWINKISSAKNDKATSIAVDSDGMVYVTGETVNSININNLITESFQFNNRSYVFAIKFNENGNYINHITIGSDSQNNSFYPSPGDIGIQELPDQKRIKLNMLFQGSYFNFMLQTGVTNPYGYPIDFTMQYDEDFKPLSLGYGKSQGNFADTVVNDQNDNKYFAGFFDSRDTVISNKRLMTRGGTDFYIEKYGKFSQSSDTTKLIEFNKPELIVAKNPINLGNCVTGNECTAEETSIITNQGKIPVTILDYSIQGDNITDFGIKNDLKGTLILPGESIDITFYFTPQAAGERNAYLSIIPDCGDAIDIDLTGIGVCGLIAEELIDMGQVVLEEESKVVYEQLLYNPTKKEIVFNAYIDGIHIGDYDIEPKGKLIIMPEAYMQFEITFSPKYFGERIAKIIFETLDGCDPASTKLTGKGVNAELNIDSVFVEKIRIKEQKDSIFTLFNLGFSEEIITNIYFTENIDNAFQLNLTEALPFSIPQKSKKEISFSFVPQNEQDYSAIVAVEIEGENEPKYALLQGSGGIPMLDVVEDCGKPVYFGDKAEVTLAVYNPSNTMNLRVRDIEILDNDIEYSWSQVQPNELEILLGNNYQFFKIDYTPVNGEDQIMRYNIIADNYDGEYPYEWKDNFFELDCPVPDYLYTNPIDFGNMMICEDDSLAIEIHNTSDRYTMVVFAHSLEVTGPDKEAFTITMDKNLLIGENEKDTLMVYFEAMHEGEHFAKLNIQTSHPSKHIEIDLLGYGNILIPRAEPTEMETLPGEEGVYSLFVDIPDLSGRYLDRIDIDIEFVNNMIYLYHTDLSSPFSQDPNSDEYLIWNVIENKNANGFKFTAEGKINAPFSGKLFELPYTEFLTSIDSSMITATVNYICNTFQYDLTLVRFGDICFEDGRMVKFSNFDFELKEPNPNPINNGMANLQFSVGLESKTEISIYNSQGIIVKKIINEKLVPGDYRLNIEVTDLSSGLYFIEMISGPFSERKKIILVD